PQSLHRWPSSISYDVLSYNAVSTETADQLIRAHEIDARTRSLDKQCLTQANQEPVRSKIVIDVQRRGLSSEQGAKQPAAGIDSGGQRRPRTGERAGGHKS